MFYKTLHYLFWKFIRYQINVNDSINEAISWIMEQKNDKVTK